MYAGAAEKFMRQKHGFKFTNKVILLTGASGGLGSALAMELSGRDAILIVTARSTHTLDELIAKLDRPENARAISADLAVPGEAERLAREALALHGRIDMLVNNAGVGYFARMEEVTEEKLRRLFEVNTFSPLALVRALAPHMKSAGSGRIVNIVSCAGRIPIPTVGAYGGSKSALAVMANTMRLELEPSGVDVVNIYPGTVDTSFEEHAFREEGRDRLCPMEHCGEPRHDIARKVLRAMSGKPGEVWLDREGRRMAVSSILSPARVDRTMRTTLRRLIDPRSGRKPAGSRIWRLWQVESAIACNLNCLMCPWTDQRMQIGSEGLMSDEVWNALRPLLSEVASVDLSGGGEVLLHPGLPERVSQAKQAGCEAGLLTNGTLLNEERARALIRAGIDWVGFSVDGATAEVYEQVRRGARFDLLVENIRRLVRMRSGGVPRVIFNFVMMPLNIHQLMDMVRLGKELGIDQINFKQCDVVRGEHGKGLELYGREDDPQIRKYEADLAAARKLAGSLGIKVTDFPFFPREQPVCDQDPRNSLFIRYDGSVAPCINLAFGGPTRFLGKDVEMPTVHYGRLPDETIPELWSSFACGLYRKRFEDRMTAYWRVIDREVYEPSMSGIDKVLADARDAMPEALPGCRVCHYLYGV
jgi:short-subunit dehydrogenase/MoaA/NifB/PqqE/SkfB family radical SAM enzyme